MNMTAFQISNLIDITGFKTYYTATLVSATSSDLFYRVGSDAYLFVFQYGSVTFFNFSDAEMSETLRVIAGYSRGMLEERLRDDYQLEMSESDQLAFEFNQMVVPVLNEDVIKVAMFNLSQSVTMDYYIQVSERLLDEVKRYTAILESKGRLKTSKRQMLRFIGKTLMVKNTVTENLYIFDVPDIALDDEYLERINHKLVQFFSLRTRFREVEYNFRVIEDNLSVFRDLFLHRESSMLELIIIILILIEVIDMFFAKLLSVF